MKKEKKKKLINDINKLALYKDSMPPSQAEKIIENILTTLLEREGFELHKTIGKRQRLGIDFFAMNQKNFELIAIDFKLYSSKVSLQELKDLVTNAHIFHMNTALLITTSEFTKDAFKMAMDYDPIAINLIDLLTLKKWVSEIEANYDETEIAVVLKTFTKKIIELISQDTTTLDQIEWRDLERVMAEVFDGIGFKVELTSSSKDGGKDIILECLCEGVLTSYIVEIKHWRSGQKVGEKKVKDFIKVVAKEKRKGGLFLSSYGFVENIMESLTEVEKSKVRLGEEDKVVSLCQTYLKVKSGLWRRDDDLIQTLFDKTV